MKIALVVLYACVILGIGWACMRKANTVQGFFLGNRSIGPWVSAFAYGTTYFSAVLFIGYAGKVGWGFGLSSLWVVVGNTLIGSYLAWKVLAKRTREMTIRLNALTMPEFLSARYDSPQLKLVSALIIFIFLVPYSASVFMGLSYMFEEIFGIPYIYALVMMTILTAAYLVMGGYLAVTLTDMVQGVIMIFGVLVMLYYIITNPQVGGITEAVRGLAEINPKLVQPVGPPGWLPLASLVILTSLGTWGLPQMVQKFYAIKSEGAIKQAIVMATFFAALMTFGAYFTGSLSHLFFDQIPVGANGKPNVDLIMPQIINQTLPEAAAVLILLLVLSASMSTLASLVLVASSAVAIDLFKGYLTPELDKSKVNLMMRFLCVVFIALSLYLAVKPTVILVLMALSWGTVAGSFLAPYLYGLYWPGTTKAGAWAGMLTGLGISVGLSLYYKMDAGLIPVFGSLAMLVPLAVVPLVSLVTPGFSQDHLDKIFNGKTTENITAYQKKGLATR